MVPSRIIFFACCIAMIHVCYSAANRAVFNMDKPASLYPVIMLPGDGGSQIEGKLNGKPSVPHRWCSTKTNDWYFLWLNLENLLPFEVDCFVDNFRLEYNVTLASSTSPPGVETRIPGWGDTNTVEFFDSSHISQSKYFNVLVNELVQKLGYVRNISIRGAPYDFRRAPSDNPELSISLKRLIEETVVLNGGKRVVLLAHSLGTLIAHTFLLNQTQAWKDKFLRAFIPVALPGAGSVKTLRLLTAGDTLGIPIQNANMLRVAERSFSSTAFLMPNPNYYDSNYVLMTTNDRNYTSGDYRQFFIDLGFPLGWIMRQDTMKGYDTSEPPGVETHCLNGRGLATPAAFDWRGKQFPDDWPKEITGDGDGTVMLHSLHICTFWRGKQSYPVFHTEFDKAEHLEILSRADFLQYILYFLSHNEVPPPSSFSHL